MIPLVVPEPEPPCNGCFKDNPVSVAARYKANWVEWSELLSAEGATFGDPAMKLTRTDARVPLDGKLVPVSPYYGASVRVAWIAK